MRELGKALEIGLPPKEAFACLPPSARADRMGPVVADLEEGMEQGMSLHDVMRDHPDVFDRYERTVVEIAERAGNIGPLLESLARRADAMRNVGRKTLGERPLLVKLIPVACLLWPLPTVSVLGYLSGVIGPLMRRWRASDYLSALELCLRCKLAPRRALTVAAVATGDPLLLATTSKMVDALDQGKLLHEAAAMVPDLPAEVRDAIGDGSGRLSLALQARTLRKSATSGVIKIGRGIHWGLAAVVIAICVSSTAPMFRIDWSAEAKLRALDSQEAKESDDEGHRRRVHKAADKLHEMMPALKRADDRVQEAVRPAGGGGVE